MISRFHNGVPTRQEVKAFNQELKTLKPLENSPVRLIAVADTGVFGEPVDLGIFPRPATLTSKEEA